MTRPILENVTRIAEQSLEADRKAARVREQLGVAIRAAAAMPDVSQAELARAAGLSRQRIGQIVNGSA